MIAGDLETAVDLSRETIRLDLHPLNPRLPADVLLLARVLSRFSQFDSAVLWLAEVDACTTDAHRLKPAVLEMLTYGLVYLNRYEEAESAFQRATTLKVPWDQWLQRRKLQSMGTRWGLAMAGGYVASAADRFDEALVRFRSARALAAKLSRDRQLLTLNNLAATATEVGDLDNADQYIDEANRLAGAESWPGRGYFLRTVGKLRLAQGRPSEARVVVKELLSSGVRDHRTLLLAAEVALVEGSVHQASTYLDQITDHMPDLRSRQELAALFERIAELEMANQPMDADERRRRATALRDISPPHPQPPEDPLREQIRSTLLGRKFGPVRGDDALILGLWLGAFLCLAVSILVPWNLPVPLVLAQGFLLILFAVAWRRFGYWVMRPKSGPELTG
jgi:tetratricopeptide (TPR) repeat protein